jgi:signal-transduction protein with cAMP-binding, CBS, and nucleotidyltransferase domain
MKEKLILLGLEDMRNLKKRFEVLTFASDSMLVYAGQIQPAAFAILEGEVVIQKQSEEIDRVCAGHLIGVDQLLKGKPVKYGLNVKAKSKIIVFGKSDILAHMNDKSSVLFAMLRPIFEVT